MIILANNGLSTKGITTLESKGFTVLTTTVAQEQLPNYIQKNKVTGLLINPSTEITKEFIDQCPTLKLIGQGSIELDNIDVSYAEQKGIAIINTPEAMATSVAELSFAHLLSGARFLYDANRNMPLDGDSQFNKLRKGYATAVELKGKTLGIFGFGKTGQEVAKLAIGFGMQVIYCDPNTPKATIEISFFDKQSVKFPLENSSKEEVLRNADFISMHVSNSKEYILDKPDFKILKTGVGIVNTATGKTINEVALIAELEARKVAFAGLDVFESEPKPEIKILMHSSISLSPHIAGTTLESYAKIGMELALQIIATFKV